MINVSLISPSLPAAINVLMPEFWNDFTFHELCIMHQVLTQQLTPAEGIMHILRQRVRQSPQRSLLPADWELHISTDDAVTDLLPLMQHYLSENNLTKNPFPTIGDYHGPDDGFNDMLCGEFEMADTAISLFVIEKDINHLADAAAFLWRPLDASSGSRQSAESYSVSKVSESFFRGQNPEILHIIYLWWVGCRNELTELFPLPFSVDPAPDAEPDPMAFSKVIHSGAGERNGTRDHIRWRTLVKELLFDIQLQMEYQAELEANKK